MLELRETSLRFPTWMLVPPTIKLFTFNIYSNLPAIIELWINNLFGWGTLSSRYPTLQNLRSDLDYSTNPEHL